MQNKVLIVIDAQEDFTFGALYNENAIKALPRIRQAVDYASQYFAAPIVYTKDTHDYTYPDTQEGKNLPIMHCRVNTPGWDICRQILPNGTNHYIMEKSTFGTLDFCEIPFIEKAEEIWLCGFCTDICVSANFQILKAMYPEVPIVVLEDACAGTTPEMHEAAIKVMKSCQARIGKIGGLA